MVLELYIADPIPIPLFFGNVEHLATIGEQVVRISASKYYRRLRFAERGCRDEWLMIGRYLSLRVLV